MVMSCLYRLGLSALLIIICHTYALAADAERKSKLTINITDQAETKVWLSLDFDPKGNAADIERALSTALNGSFTERSAELYTDNDEDEGKPAAAFIEWDFNARCDGAFAKRWSIISGQINFTPLAAALKSAGAPTLELTINLPPSPYYNVNLPMKIDNNRHYLMAHYQFDTAQPPAEPLKLAFGYRLQDLIRRYGPLPAVTILPLLLVVWRRRVSLSHNQPDLAAAGFNYYCTFNVATTIAWAGWYIVAYPLNIDIDDLIRLYAFGSDNIQALSLLRIVAGNFGLVKLVIKPLYYFLPPLLVIFLCTYISYPVFERMSAERKTRRELMLYTLLSLASFALPLMLYIAGVSALLSHNYEITIICFLMTFTVPNLCRVALTAMSDESHFLLNICELRDRIMALAATAGVKINEIVVINCGRQRIANAFAVNSTIGDSIMFTDCVLPYLTRREMDAVIAHELAHLKYRHPWFALVAFAGAALIPTILAPYLLNAGSRLLLAAAVLAAVMCYYYIKRRFEYAADAHSIAYTGDAEALISALAKIDRLNCSPLQWSNWISPFMTHPHTMSRIKALASQAGIGAERVQEIVAAPKFKDIFREDNPDHYDTWSGGDTSKPITENGAAEQKIYTIILAKTILLSLGIALLVYGFAREGGLLHNLLDRLYIHPILAMLAGALAAGGYYCRKVKAQLLASTTDTITITLTEPACFPNLDLAKLARLTEEIEALGFRPAADYSVDFPGNVCDTFARLFINDEHKCYLELQQLFTKGQLPYPLCYSVFTELEQGWMISSVTARPDATSYIMRLPKTVRLCRADSSLAELVRAHLSACERIAPRLGVKAASEVSAQQVFAISRQECVERKRMMAHKSMLRILIEGAIFEYRPKTDWNLPRRHRE